ncbi:MAG: PcfB family protein, partial [Lachnospiraceae bacterium]|nr:PcfB family protein [Lachnospiraceae bacterium]
AKQLAVLLYAILKEQKKKKGRARLETLIRSGKPLTVFSVKESDLKKFVQEAKRYGILYCAVRDPKGSSDGMEDIMVREEDAPRINRIVERFRFASVTEAAQIKTEIQKAREEKSHAKEEKPQKAGTQKESVESRTEPEKEKPERTEEDMLVDELLGNPVQKEGTERENPSMAKTEKSQQPVYKCHREVWTWVPRTWTGLHRCASLSLKNGHNRLEGDVSRRRMY